MTARSTMLAAGIVLATTGAARADFIHLALYEEYTPEAAATTVRAIDLDGDEHLDIVTANRSGGAEGFGSISVFISDGLGGFGEPVHHPVPAGDETPRSLAFGDFDADGDVDLATANWNSNSVTLFVNDGSAAFAASSLPTSELPTYVATADIDDDDDLDLIVANSAPSGNRIQVHLNDGGGVFTLGPVVDVFGEPRSIAVDDLDLDGWLDLAVACRSANQLAIVLNDGAGGLLAAMPVDVGVKPRDVTAADFDDDGDPDLAVAMFMDPTLPGQCWILENDGLGGFAIAGIYPAGTAPHGVHHADLDNDCDIDVAVANVGAGFVTLLLNDGGGVFSSIQSPVMDSASSDVWLANIDDHPLPDVMIGSPANLEPGGRIRVRLNTTVPGEGCFDPSECDGADPTDCDGSGLPDECEIELGLAFDCNGNGVPDNCDIADDPGSGWRRQRCHRHVRERGRRRREWIHRRGRSRGRHPQLGDVWAEVAVPRRHELGWCRGGRGPGAGDRELDGLMMDEAIFRSRTLACLAASVLVTWQPLFAEEITFAAGVDYEADLAPISAALGDLDGDDDLDVVVTNLDANSVLILVNDGAGSFTDGPLLPTGPSPRSPAVADLDGDGDLEIVVPHWGDKQESVGIFENLGDLTFAPFVEVAVGPRPRTVIAVDLDGDEAPDLATANFSGASVCVRLNDGAGGFGEPAFYTVGGLPGSTPGSVSAGDIDGDRDLDLVASCRGTSDVTVLRNNGDGTFATVGHFPTGSVPRHEAIADLDGDGDADVCTSDGGGTVTLLVNTGAGSLEPGLTIPVGGLIHSVVARDFDVDGDQDLVVVDTVNDSTHVLEQVGDDLDFEDEVILSTDGPIFVVAGDLDADDLEDVVVVNLGAHTVSVLINETLIGPCGGFDCNDNDVGDTCDISDGTSQDCNGNGIPDECDVHVVSLDCNANGVPDECEIDDAPELDVNGDGVLDPCQQAGDLNGDGVVASPDLIEVLLGWGACSDGAGCAGDANFDGTVDISDLVVVIANWS